MTRADYVQEGVAQGNVPPLGAYSQAYFAPRAESLPVGNGGEYRNRPDYHQRYLGLEVQATKRMSNRWMGRVGFSTNTHREYFDDPSTAVQDPTPSTTWPNIDGGAYVTQTNGSGKSEIYLLLPRYQFTAGGAYQLPYRINLAGSLVAREGFGQPFFATVESADPALPEKRVLLVDPDDNRLPGVFTLDLRAEKALRVRRLEPDADARHVQRDELVDDPRPPVRRDRDRRDGVLQHAGDHEPAADQAGGAVPVLSSRVIEVVSTSCLRAASPDAKGLLRCRRLAARGAVVRGPPFAWLWATLTAMLIRAACGSTAGSEQTLSAGSVGVPRLTKDANQSGNTPQLFARCRRMSPLQVGRDTCRASRCGRTRTAT